MRAAVYQLRGNGGALRTCPAMAEGIIACGDTTYFVNEDKFTSPNDFDVAVFWGYTTPMQNIFKAFRTQGKPVVYLDLGYWNRGQYYKVAVNARHPTTYFQDIKHDSTRRKQFDLKLLPWVRGDKRGNILLAGMGPKSAWAEGLEPVESWERATVVELRKHTDRKIIYRPKPSQGYGRPIAGTEMRTGSLEQELDTTFAVVTHHGNVAVDGLVYGVPTFTWYGAAYPMSKQRLDEIESPHYPEARKQWLNDLAYCQWSLEEMRKGKVWKHLKSEGLI